MATPGEVTRIHPTAGIPGGEVTLEYETVPAVITRDLDFGFDGAQGHVTAAGKARALVRLPEIDALKPVQVVTNFNSAGPVKSTQQFLIGRKLAGDLHPVANPAFDPGDDSLYVTRSGSRGEHVPVSIFRIAPNGTIEDFSSDIMNPTSIAFDRTGRMFVTSRFDGCVYRVGKERQLITFATDLGIATGLAFNRDGEMFVGDRSGTIYRISEIGEAVPWAEHEPSVSAYHLAMGPDDALYVTGPTVSSFDSITRIGEDGIPSIFFRGLGRPQGLAFDRDGNLYVAASLKGRRGIVRVSPDASHAELVVAGMNLVGLAFGGDGVMVVATNDAVYSIPLGIQGTLLN